MMTENQPKTKPRFELRWGEMQHDELCYVHDNKTNNDIPGLPGRQSASDYLPLIKLLNRLDAIARQSLFYDLD